MKIHKLIELWKEMETTQETEEKENQMETQKTDKLLEKLDPEELLNTLQFLQRCAGQAGYYYNLQAPGSEFGKVQFAVTENGQPIVAQVKIWDHKEHPIRTRFHSAVW